MTVNTVIDFIEYLSGIESAVGEGKAVPAPQLRFWNGQRLMGRVLLAPVCHELVEFNPAWALE